jgi:hypothetical protein
VVIVPGVADDAGALFGSFGTVTNATIALGAADDEYVDNTGSFTVSSSVPEPSTWAMMLPGFAGLSFAGFRRARARTHKVIGMAKSRIVPLPKRCSTVFQIAMSCTRTKATTPTRSVYLSGLALAAIIIAWT